MLKQRTLLRIAVSILIFVTVASPAMVMAEGMTMAADLEYVASSIETTYKQTGEKEKTDFAYFQQQYDLDIQREIFPYLNLHAGGLFKLFKARTYDGESRTTQKEGTIQPFVELNLNNPLYRAGASYRESEIKTSQTLLPRAERFVEEYRGLWAWRPEGFPSLDLNYQHTNSFKNENVTITDPNCDPVTDPNNCDPKVVWLKTSDAVNELFTLRSAYEYREYSFDYTYTRTDLDRKIAESGVQMQIHNGGVRYSSRFLDDRLLVGGESRWNYATQDPWGSGTLDRPTITAGAAFYLLDDATPDNNTPGEFTLVDATNPLTSLTNVNIGRNGPLNPVSAGLDFGFPIDVDTIYVTPKAGENDPSVVSPEEIARVANSFVWRIFTSDDQENWTERNVNTAEYITEDNRFEISFSPRVSAQYIKVVVVPLSILAPDEIRIEQLEGYIRIPVGRGVHIEDFTQNYSFGLQYAISDTTTTTYDAYYNVADNEPFGTKKTTLTNGVGLRHIFNSVFSGHTRLQRTDSTFTGIKDAVDHNYTASLRGDYLETFNQMLSFSAVYNNDQLGKSSTNAILLRNNADLYKGWSANLDLGYTWKDPAMAEKTNSRFLRVNTSLDPNPRMHLSLNYSMAWVSGGDGQSFRDQNGAIEAFWVPLRTLSMNARLRYSDRDREGERSRTAQDYSINWSPFPDGIFKFSVRYSEFRDAEDRRNKMATPQVQWQVARGVRMTLGYSTGSVESATEKREIGTFTANLRIFY